MLHPLVLFLSSMMCIDPTSYSAPATDRATASKMTNSIIFRPNTTSSYAKINSFEAIWLYEVFKKARNYYIFIEPNATSAIEYSILTAISDLNCFL